MTNIVINSEGWYLHLSDEHVAWLHANGYPSADCEFCECDRSNPVLIACIEAIRATKQPLVSEAKRLLSVAEAAELDGSNARKAMSKELDALLDLLVFRPYQKKFIISEIRKVLIDGLNWNEVTSHAAVAPCVPVDDVWAQLNVITDTYKADEDKFRAIRNAWSELHQYIAENSLRHDHGSIEYFDKYDIESYDETRFVAKVEKEYSKMGYSESEYEHLVLTPYLTRDTVDSFVKTGDTDGLMDYLKSLNIGGFMDIRDGQKTKVRHDCVATAHEDQAEFEALLASIT